MSNIFSKVDRGIRFFKNYGVKEFGIRVMEKYQSQDISYEKWQKKYKTTKKEIAKQRKECAAWEEKPCFFVVVRGAEANKLQTATKESLEEQSYSYWKTEQKDLKEGEADWIIFLKNGDILEPDAFYRIASMIRDDSSNYDVIYSDHDEIKADGCYAEPDFKPDFNLDLLRTHNYMGDFLAVKKELALCICHAMEEKGSYLWSEQEKEERADCMQASIERYGSRLYEFIFRCVEKDASIGHVPRVLYHRVITERAGNRDIILAHLNRLHIAAEVEEHPETESCGVKYAVQKKELISIIIPNKDEAGSLEKCLASIEESDYSNYEVIVVENNSSPETFEYYRNIAPFERREKMQDGQEVRVLEGTLKGGQRLLIPVWEHGFNYSRLNNFGVQFAKGAYYVLLNNDIEILSRDWLERLLGNCEREEVAASGIRLFYPDDTVQHAGIVVGIGGHKRGIASNMFVGLKRKEHGYQNRASLQADYSAVTAACMMVDAKAYHAVGGFTEELAVAFNDVDFCLKLREEGKLVVYVPEVEAYHYESKSRGAEDTPEKAKRFQGEIDYMREKWKKILLDGDPYYNSNLSRIKSDYSLGRL